MTPPVLPLAHADFESYSEADIAKIGAWLYSKHPSTELLCMSYNLGDGVGVRLWVPGMPPPVAAFRHIAAGGLVAAFNSFFEWCMWNNIGHARLGWPYLPLHQTRDTSATAGAWTLPKRLEYVAEALGAPPKDAAGHRVMLQVTKPRKPTKNDPSTRFTPAAHSDKFAKLYAYCNRDVNSEEGIENRCPPLPPYEVDVWLRDQDINARGVCVDVEAALAAASLIKQAEQKYNPELRTITGGYVESATKLKALGEWCEAQGHPLPNMQADTITDALTWPQLPAHVRRALEIRSKLAGAAVKKVYALLAQVDPDDNRVRGMFKYAGARRTARWSGSDVQPQNLKSNGPPVMRCKGCGEECGYPKAGGAPNEGPTCGESPKFKADWGVEFIEMGIVDMIEAADPDGIFSFDELEAKWGDVFDLIGGCVRGMFIAAPGHDLISSDFSAIEAVVLACLAGEEWRIEVFETHGKIYEKSASLITGTPFEDFMRHKQETGQHHPLRKKIGKFAELASGYQGWVGAWVAFGADEYLSEEEIKQAILKWRGLSPMIVKFWEKIQEAAVSAVLNPGTAYQYREIAFQVDPSNGCLYCLLPSGRLMAYHGAQVYQAERFGKMEWRLSHMNTNSPSSKWGRRETWGGRLTENIVQAVARDIQAQAILNAERAGYKVVLHTHDEIACEVPTGWGSVEEVEELMQAVPEWCAHWPIKAAGGWRGRRYRKD